MATINRKILHAHLNESGNALRRLANYLNDAGAAATAVENIKTLANEADALLELVETGAEIEGDL